MKKLHKYLLKKFLINLIIAITGWVILFIVINLIEQASNFIDNKATVGQIFFYYLYFIPYIISLTLPFSMLLAVLFAVSNMAQNNEIIAQFSSGISLYKILTPLFITGFFISIIAGVFNELIVPESNERRLNLDRYEIKKNPKNTGKINNNINVQDSEIRKMSLKYFNGRKNEGREVSLQTFDGPVIIERIDAKTMIWQDSVWLFKTAQIRKFTNGTEVTSILKDTVITNSRIKPENLVTIQKKPEEMSFAELNGFIAELQAIGANPRKWYVERHLKLALPFANFIVILIGAPFASRKRRGGIGLSFGLSLLISFTFFVIVRFGQVLGHQGTLEPLMAAWLGNLIFLVIGLYTLITVKK